MPAAARPRAQVAALLLAAACASPRTVTLQAAAADPGTWRTFQLAPLDRDREGGDYQTLLGRSLGEAAARELEARGYKAADDADLLVDLDLHTERRIERRATAAVTFVYVPSGDGLGAPGLASELGLVQETTLFATVLDRREPAVVWQAARIVRTPASNLTGAREAAASATRALFASFPFRAGRDEPLEVGSQPALELYEREARAGDPGAQYLLGRMHAVGHGAPRDLELARAWYERAAEQGHPAAAASLGLLLLEGPAELRDDAAAARWLGLAAEQGVASAQFALGRMLLEGRTGAELEAGARDAEAADWLLRAARQELPEAQTDLATLYLRGRGVEQDAAEAARWYRRAAEQGERRAQTRLATMLELGRGVERDAVQAAMWYLLAADAGEAQARERLDLLAKTLTPEETAQAQRRAESWLGAR